MWSERQYETAALFAEREREAAIARRKKIASQSVRGDGICIECDRSIPEARLKASPGAIRCIECQGEYERQGNGA